MAYTEHVYEYVEHGGTSVSSSSLGVPEHEVVKTLVMETDKGEPLVVLMHGDRKVSTKELARVAGAKRVFPCKPEDATRHSGYLVGGCSPFGTRKRMPVYMERSILELAAHLHQRRAPRLPPGHAAGGDHARPLARPC